MAEFLSVCVSQARDAAGWLRGTSLAFQQVALQLRRVVFAGPADAGLPPAHISCLPQLALAAQLRAQRADPRVEGGVGLALGVLGVPAGHVWGLLGEESERFLVPREAEW